ncbi:MAG: FeoA family protein [Phycisphaerales bacterium]|jgi:Fe2+ transport system protein FeoA|nr:FeoA family protein [Phycisphaerales bacterium]
MLASMPDSIPEITTRRVPLTEVSRGSRVRVDLAGLESDDRELLRAMGLRPECVVEVCRVGEPCILEVREGCGGGCRIGLSRRLADRVLTDGTGV